MAEQVIFDIGWLKCVLTPLRLDDWGLVSLMIFRGHIRASKGATGRSTGHLQMAGQHRVHRHTRAMKLLRGMGIHSKCSRIGRMATRPKQ